MKAKGLVVDTGAGHKITECVRATLVRLTAKGLVRKIITWPVV
jgi:hypothetical protein